MPLFRQPHFALLLGAAWLLIVIQLIVEDWPGLTIVINDSDDAFRLVQVHRFLAGQGWFDLHEARIAPPLGYDSHWSRLIDAGLAGLFVAFKTIVDAALAERLMLAVWPVLWLIPTIAAAAAIAWRLGGRAAALIVLVLAVSGLPGWGQFRLGRIDHHNVQIALALLTVAMTVWSDRVRWLPTRLAPQPGAGDRLRGHAGARAVRSRHHVALHRRGRRDRALHGRARCGAGVARLWLSAAAGARRFSRHGPAGSLAADRLRRHRDQLRRGRRGGGLARRRGRHIRHRRASRRALCGGRRGGRTGLGGFRADRAALPRWAFRAGGSGVRSIWLDRVNEMQSLVTLLQTEPTIGLAHAAFPATALAALAIVAQRLRQDFAVLPPARPFCSRPAS